MDPESKEDKAIQESLNVTSTLIRKRNAVLIRRMKAEGVNITAIGRVMGVSRQRIHNILNRSLKEEEA